ARQLCTICLKLQSCQADHFVLTRIEKGHNNTYICAIERSHAQTQEARSKAARTQTHRHSEPSACGCFRHLVPRESLLRLQRPSAGALRDAAPAPGRWGFRRRGLLAVWRFPSHFLSDGSSIRTERPDWFGAQAARPQGGAQAVRSGDRTRTNLEGFVSRSDHRRMYPGRAGEIRDHCSSPQPGTGDGGQKKTASGELKPPFSYAATEAYEALRRQPL